MKNSIVIMGAGNIGRGVVGYLFDKGNYDLVLYDVFQEQLNGIQEQGYYTVNETDGNDTNIEYKITNFEVLQHENHMNVVESLSNTSLIACCVYSGAFKSISELIASAIRLRIEKDDYRPLNVLMCVNEIDAPELVSKYISNFLNDKEMEYFEQYIGICQVMVLAAALPSKGAIKEKDPYVVTVTKGVGLEIDGEAFKGKEFVISGISFIPNAKARIYRKLYVGNMRHAMGALMGDYKGYTTVDVAQHDYEIRRNIIKAAQEAHTAVKKEFQFDTEEDTLWLEYLNSKLDSNVKDDIKRVVANIDIKLARDNRFIGPALMAIKNNITPFYLARGIAYAYLYNGSDEASKHIQETIKSYGIDYAIRTYSQLNDSDWYLIDLIKNHYEDILEGN